MSHGNNPVQFNAILIEAEEHIPDELYTKVIYRLIDILTVVYSAVFLRSMSKGLTLFC